MLMLLDYWSHFDSKKKEAGKKEEEGRGRGGHEAVNEGRDMSTAEVEWLGMWDEERVWGFWPGWCEDGGDISQR